MSFYLKDPWLTTPQTTRLMTVLDEFAHARFVGGCVRNALIGQPVNDIDIAIDVPPEEVMDALEAENIRVVPTGLSHGTLTAVIDGKPFEITTLRKDVETDGRRAQVTFISDWAEDAARRDFTINALYAEADGKIIDPLRTGLPDLMARRVRFIHDPETRIREDYLRILRLFRFHAWYGTGPLDEEALKAANQLKEGLDGIAIERITVELWKTLAAPDPSLVVGQMAQSGILSLILEKAEPGAPLDTLISIEHKLGLPPDPLRRFCALMGTREPKAFAEQLRLSNEQIGAVIARRFTPDLATFKAEDARRLGYLRGSAPARDVLAIAAARAGILPQREIFDATLEGGALNSPLTAADLLSAGIKTGPELGEMLRQAQQAWLDSGFSLDKSALLRHLELPPGS